MINFLAHAMTISGLPLLPGDPNQIAELEEAAEMPLPQDFKYLLEVGGGDGGALASNDVHRHMAVENEFEFLRLEWLIEEQRELTASRATEILGRPLFLVSSITGPGTRLVIAGEQAGSPLLAIDGFTEDPVLGSHSLIGTSLFTFLDALLLPARLADKNRYFGDPLVTVRLERKATETDIELCLQRFDEMIDAMCALDVGSRSDVIGLANIVAQDHPWFRKPSVESGVLLTVPDGSVTSMRSGLVLVILGVAMASVLGGEITDQCGCMDAGGSVLSPDQAVRQLIERHGVGGGIDELLLRFRYRHF